jgi:hypothetical protein
MTQESYRHPIAPAPELLTRWENDWFNERENVDVLLIQAFQAGADQELKACCEWLATNRHILVEPALRAARRSRPPSLKEQALKELAWIGKHLDMPLHNYCNAIHTISRALEQLPDNE